MQGMVDSRELVFWKHEFYSANGDKLGGLTAGYRRMSDCGFKNRYYLDRVILNIPSYSLGIQILFTGFLSHIKTVPNQSL